MKRLLFIDIFRGWAVLAMIETHVVNAWMDAGLRHSEWFPYLNLVNGFVAPSFLFIAGVSFAIVCRTKWDDMTHLTPTLGKQMRRLFMILGIGYLLHIPRIEWNGMTPSIVAADLNEFFRADVLHTIAVSMIILQIVLFLSRKRNVFLFTLSIMTLTSLLATPLLWKTEFTVHPFITNYLNGLNNPLFPLFPWCVFLWSGALIAFAFLDYVESDDEKNGVVKITLSGAGIFLIGLISDWSPVQLFTYDNFWLVSPNWVLMRLGILLILFGMFWLLDFKNWHTSAKVRTIGSQSLFAYVVHLWLIYSITGEKASWPIFSQDNSVPVTLAMLVILIVIMYYLTIGWTLAKKKIFGKAAG
ncbi:DUF1624 domain-containing protein [bacterium]|nr:DUF1624 domain-containing protein [bacterium]